MNFYHPNRMHYLAQIMGGVLALFSIWMNVGCNPQPQRFDAELYPGVDSTPAPILSQTPAPSTLTPAQNPTGSAVTFYKDILPLLNTNLPDRQYECTQCHASYADPAVVAKASLVDDIIASVESGFMPMNEGPRMRKEDIEVLKLWRRSGMQIGTQIQSRPANTSNATGTR
jgi:hypothetical protein